MTEIARRRESIPNGIHVLDSGMASELEYQCANVDGPLWSAHLLKDAPEHRLWVAAAACDPSTSGW
jgi:S-methylmethionine-dependent homocysteine/selenocysteine methylase